MTERPEILTNLRSDRVARVRALSGRSARVRHGQFLVEGPQAVRELIHHRPQLVRDVYGTQAPLPTVLLAEAQAAGCYTHSCSEEVVRAMSPDAQGILAVASTPPPTPLDVTGATLVAILPAVSDPGNAGTLIRISDAVAADAVIICHGGVELTNPKVVRATAGSLFHLPIITDVSFAEAIAAARSTGLNVVGTDAAAGLSLFDPAFDAGQPVAWVFGNEAHGLDPDQREACDQLVSIPLYGRAESLNVAAAAALCLYESARSLRS